MPTRRSALALLGAAAATLGSPLRAATAYPQKAVRWIVPYPAGGGSDFIARAVAQPLSARMGQTVLVDNKPGGTGAIGIADLLRSPADGHTMIHVDNGMLVFNSVLYRKLSYAPQKDLKLVTMLTRGPQILVVGPGSTARTAKELIEQIRTRPGPWNYGSAGTGTPQHLGMELLAHEARLKMAHAAYKGSTPALGDLAGGQIPMLMSDYTAASGFLQSGKLRALAVADTQRFARLPDVPTFAEIGLPGVVMPTLVGVAVHHATPDDKVLALQKFVAQALKDPQLQARFGELGIQTVGNSPQEFTRIVDAEVARWHPLIRSLNLVLD
jgi:tripartite-type tricarboxylate transporter receptor subunit TctC